MKRLIFAVSILTLGGLVWGAGGGFNGLTVSSGTYQAISTYGNDDGGNRQAIIIGNRTSSDTVKTDGASSLSVYVNNPTTATISGSISNTSFAATQAVDSALGASVSIKGSSNTVQISGTPNVAVTNTPTVDPSHAVDSSLNASVSIKGSSNTVQASQSGAWSVNPGTGTQNVAVINTVNVSGASGGGIIQTLSVAGSTTSVGYALGSSSLPCNVINVPAVSQSGTWTVQPGNTVNSTPWLVDPSHAIDSSMNASVSIKGTSNTITANDTLLVSSNTAFPSAIADAGNVRTMADKYGRVVTMPIAPFGQILVATATLTTTTAEQILISSTSAKFVRLIGCIGENTSSTAADITIRLNGGPAGINAGSFKLGMSVSNVPVGFFPPGGIVSQTANANTTIQGSASVTSLNLTCWYDLE